MRSTRGIRRLGSGPEELAHHRFGYYPKVLTGYGYIFLYVSRFAWASNEPSRYVVATIDSMSISEHATTREDLQDLAATLHQRDAMEPAELPELPRRRGRRPAADPIAHELNAAEEQQQEQIRIVGRAHMLRRSVRQYWNPLPCHYCGAIDLLYAHPPKQTRCCNNGKAAAYDFECKVLAPLQPLPPFLLDVVKSESVSDADRDPTQSTLRLNLRHPCHWPTLLKRPIALLLPRPLLNLVEAVDAMRPRRRLLP